MENRMMNILKNTKTHRLTPDPILSRICLASLIWIIIGGFSMSAWGDETVVFKGDSTWGSNSNDYTPATAFEMSKPHVNFFLRKPMRRYKDAGYFSLKSNNTTADLDWSVLTGYTIAVKTLTLNGKGYNGNTNGYLIANNDGTRQIRLCDGEDAISLNLNCSTQYTSTSSTSIYMFGPDGTPFGNTGKFTFKVTREDIWSIPELNFYTITLTYTISPNPYTIQYNANRGVNTGSGSMSDTEATYDSDVTLRENTFTNDGLTAITVTYEANGGSMASTSVTAGLGFKEWNTKSDGSGDKSYTDGETGVFNLAASGTATLYAQWQPETTLPSATKTNQVLEGWYSDSDLTSKVGRAGDKFNPSRDTTLYAKWIDKYTPSVTCAKTSLKVGEELSSALAFDDTLGITFVNIIKEISSVRSGNKVIEYDKANNKIYARNAGIDTLRFTQPETTEIKSGVIDIVFTVTKHDPSFTWNTPAAYYYNTTVSDFLVKTAGGDYDVTSSSEQVADMDGDDLKIYNVPGTVKIKYVHDETYKWNEKKDSVSFTPEWKSNQVTLDVTESNYTSVIEYHYAGGSDRYIWADGGVTLGSPTAHAWDGAEGWDSRYIDIHFSGMPDSISFTYGKTVSTASGMDWWVKEKTEDGEWGEATIWTASNDNGTCKKELKPDTRWVRLRGYCNYGIYFRNIKITKKEFFKTTEDELDFKKNVNGITSAAKSFKFKHANAGYTVKAELSDSTHYQIAVNSQSSFKGSVIIPNTGGDRVDSSVVYVKYIPILAGEEKTATHPATITFTDQLNNSTTVTLTGTTVDKYTPTISWTGEKTTFEVGDDITNGFTVKNENGEPITGDLEWTFESDDEDVVDVDGTTLTAHTLDPATKGDIETATITGTLTAGETYYGGSQTVVLTVKRKDNTITISGVEETMLVDATMTGISVTSTNSSGPSYTVTSMPGSDTIVYNLGAGTIVSKHITGPFSWTIHQAADGTYKAADAELNVEVVLAPEDESEKIYMYDSGSNDDAGWKVSEFAEVSLVPVGVATTVWFDAKRTSSGKKKLWCEHYVNSEWSMFDSKAGDAVTRDSYNTSLYKTGVGLTATKVRFNSEDNDVVYVRNVKIQCRGHILTDVAGDELAITKQDDGESLIYLGDEGYETFTVYYGLAKNSGDVTLICDNSHFKFGVEDEKEAGLTLVDNDAEHTQCGNQEVKVYYNPTDVGTETAHVTIYNSSYSKTITITGTCKYPQTISWNIGSRLKEDAVNKISNAANATVGTITYSSSNTDVVEVTDDGTKLLAKATGSATITASATGNDIYYAATSTIDVTVVESLAKEAVEVDEIGDWTGDIDIWTPVVVLSDAHITISTEKVAYSLEIEDGATVTIASTGGLTVGEGGISGASAENLILKADADVESSTLGRTGYLRVSPRISGDMPSASVEMYSIAYANNSTREVTWQYVGVPVTGTFYGWDLCEYGDQFIYGWDEETAEWFNAFEERIYPFKGYSFTQNKYSTGDTFTFKGTLQAPHTENITLSYTEDLGGGYHVLANSFAAPIDITQMGISDFVNATATIYLFNTGYYKTGGTDHITADESSEAGQYIAIPVGTANMIREVEASFPVVIPAMQGFCVQANSAEASLKLDYSKVIWGANYGTHPNKPMRVGARLTEEQETNEPNVTDFIKVTLSDGEAADNLYLLASDSYDKSYENGYDAPKMMSDDPALPNVFAVEDDGQFAIDATSDIEGTFLGVRTGKATDYTLYFSHVNCETEWMLLDIKTNKTTLIQDGASYSFSTKENEQNELIVNRFLIVESDGNAGVATGTEEVTIQNKMQKFIYNNQMYILKDGVLYDARGYVVKR